MGSVRDASRRRTPRYPIAVPVRFRERGAGWEDGTTMNIGADGLLFRTQAAPAPAALLELLIALMGSFSGPHVECSGHVVRSAPSPEDGDGVLVAVTIDRFQLRAG